MLRSPLYKRRVMSARPRLWKMPHTVTRPLRFVNDKLVKEIWGKLSEDGG